MVDYQYEYGADQMECDDIKDLTTQLRYLAKDKAVVENVKLVENEDRWNEEKISFTLAQQVIRILGYNPKYMSSRNKKLRNK